MGAGFLAATGVRAHDDMTIGHMIISGFRGTRAGDPEVDRICRYLESGEIGGVILLKRNITSPEQILALTKVFREASAIGQPIISIDQEGGRVARIGSWNGFRDWMSADAIVRTGMSDEEVRGYYTERARELGTVGINVNFGPVVDLNVNPTNPVIGSLGRSYGSDSADVVRYARQFVRAHRAVGVKTCIKHFPGHGSSSSDSHLRRVDISSSWGEVELVPFQDLQNTGDVDSIMMAHVYHPSFSEKKGRPASLSAKGIEVVRKAIAFDGPTFTDDMQMKAITGTYALGRAAVMALNAGNSFLIYSNYGKRDSIETAAEVSEALMIASATRDLDPTRIAPQYRRAMAFLAEIRLQG